MAEGSSGRPPTSPRDRGGGGGGRAADDFEAVLAEELRALRLRLLAAHARAAKSSAGLGRRPPPAAASAAGAGDAAARSPSAGGGPDLQCWEGETKAAVPPATAAPALMLVSLGEEVAPRRTPREPSARQQPSGSEGVGKSPSSEGGGGASPRRGRVRRGSSLGLLSLRTPSEASEDSRAAGAASRGSPRGALSPGHAQQSVALRWLDLVMTALGARDGYLVRDCWKEDCELFPGQPAQVLDGDSSSDSSGVGGSIVCDTWKELHGPMIRRRSRPSLPKRMSTLMEEGENCQQSLHKIAAFLVLHPFSWSRAAWVLLGFAFVGFDVLSVTMEVFNLPNMVIVEFVRLIAGLYWIADIGMSFMTGVVGKSGLIMNLRRIARHYLTTWFGFDVSITALQWLVIFAGFGETGTGPLAFVSLARYSLLLRFVKFGHCLSNVLEGINSVITVLTVRVSLYFLAVLFWVHISGCAWYWLGKSHDRGWVSQRPDLEAFPKNFVISMHWAAAQLQGEFEFYNFESEVEHAFAVSHKLVSIVVLAMFVSKLTTVMHAIEDIKAQRARQMNSARRYLQANSISPELAMSVRKYVEWKQSLDAKRRHSTGEQERELMQMLPIDLRRALLDESRWPLIAEHAVFYSCRQLDGRFSQRLVCDLLCPETYAPDECVFSYGMVCTRLYVVAGGESTYFKYGSIMRALLQNGRIRRGSPLSSSDMTERYCKKRSEVLTEGAAICEPVLWTRWVHVGNFRSKTNVSLLTLEAKGFEELVASYPQVQQALQSHAHFFLQQLNHVNELSDRFGTDDALRPALFGR